MLAWFRTLPLFVVLLWISAGAMVLPAAMAVLTEDFATGRRFFYASLMTMIAATLIGIATQGNRRGDRAAAAGDAGAVLPAPAAGPGHPDGTGGVGHALHQCLSRHGLGPDDDGGGGVRPRPVAARRSICGAPRWDGSAAC
jgi:hypothetical protein